MHRQLLLALPLAVLGVLVLRLGAWRPHATTRSPGVEAMSHADFPGAEAQFRHESDLFAAANAGSGYSFGPALDKPRLVVLWGLHWLKFDDVIPLSGCPRNGQAGVSCPMYPRCRIMYSDSEDALKTKADVVVMLLKERDPPFASWIFSRARNSRPVRVLYRREPFWDPPMARKPSEFDLDMSFSASAGLVNPIFMRTPAQLQPWPEPLERPLFAASLISDCHTASRREGYLHRMLAVLGPQKLHQYGSCGDGRHVLARHRFTGLEKYKFFLSFESTVLDGYVTEKLFRGLTFGPCPVYLGATDVPNITKTPSFINAADFASPEDLVHHLLELGDNPTAYAQCHEWRKSPATAFTDAYLQAVARNVPGPMELRGLDVNVSYTSRRAACCRLCNPAFVAERVASTDVSKLLARPKSVNWIHEQFYRGGSPELAQAQQAQQVDGHGQEEDGGAGRGNGAL